MKILVTGSTGLIGSAVVRRLDQIHDVYANRAGDGTRLDLREPDTTLRLVLQLEPDVVVHCAACIGGIAAQKADPSMPVLDNLVMGAWVIDACAKVQSKLVFLSSSTVYPMTLGLECAAEESWPRRPDPQYRGVGGMKIYLEELIDFYRETFGLRAVILRPTAVYGPGDRGFSGNGHVIPDLLRRADAGELPLMVWGDGKTVRDFVYVDDVADAVAAVINREAWGGVFNVGSGEQTTIAKLADEVLLAVHGAHKIVELEDRSSGGLLRFDATQPVAIPWRAVSIVHIRDVLGWAPTVTLHDGLRRTLSWWRTQRSAKGGRA